MKAAGAFDGLPLFKAAWEAQIQTVRKQYEDHLVNALSPQLREGAIEDFEKRFLKPIRDAAGVS